MGDMPPGNLDLGATDRDDFDGVGSERGEASHDLDTPGPPHTPPRNPFNVSQVTPQRVSSHDSEGAYVKIEDIQKAVRQELEGSWVAEDKKTFQAELKSTIKAAYPDLESQAQIWLDGGNAGYDQDTRRWSEIPSDANLEKKLYKPIDSLLRSIVHQFGNDIQPAADRKPGQTLKKRQVALTWKQKFEHTLLDAKDEKYILKSCPDICILCVGPAATMETEISSVPSYPQVATPVEIKLHETFAEIVKDQIAVYGREVFITQPNRRFVYVPVMTGKTIRVIKFDRSGGHYSEPIDYHEDPIFFIQLVVLFSSLNEELVGYDTSIYWENGKRMLEMTPSEVWDSTDPTAPYWKPNEDVLVFEILNEHGKPAKDAMPVFARRTIRSRGTVCWRVRRGGREFLIKDYWGVASRTRESQFLKQVAGLKGVGQMYAFVDDGDSTYRLRGFTADSRMMSTMDSYVPDRSLTRLALEMYMTTLNTATSARQLLSAVHDIVSAHRDSLLVKDILHRDISFNNLLLSSKRDEHGVLIDFDMAKKMQDLLASNGTEGDSRTGTRAYQSFKVLLQSDKLGHHDHMDDLESIYYVLFFVCYAHDLNGNLLPVFPRHIAHWHTTSLSAEALGDLKRSFLQSPIDAPMTRFCGVDKDILAPLITQLRKFFAKRLYDIGEATSYDDPTPFPPYSSTNAKADYSQFLELVDNAIKKLPAVPVPPPPPSPSNSAGSASSKRGRDIFDDELGASPHKKLFRPSRASVSTAAGGQMVAQAGPSSCLAGEDEDEETSGSGEDYVDEYRPLRGGRKQRYRR
ncbi:hypothetical protein DFH07DRAFT_920118 [Mycena maculata]|uniref:Protein kinase domain-containing protein n=1 Tax=Mycena maculata TaxID=230809 RepID=A0AAD7J645_9AGAR|nr:hypothetical protein DFH07DRAFT_920118 [Mycena maculata]